MTFDYISLRDGTVEPLITEFGKPGNIVVNVPPSGAPWESQFGSEESYPITIVQTKFQKSDNSGTLVEMGDVLFIISTQGVTLDPELAQRIIANGTTYQIIRVDPVQPGTTIMLWKVHARK